MKVLLVGAGHAHLETLRRLGRHRSSIGSITVVNPEPSGLYSGMVPGVVAGHFAEREIALPLAGVMHAAGARLVLGSLAGLDVSRGTAMLADGRSLTYDVVSLGIGSEGAPRGLAHASEATAVRPLARFLAQWRATVDAAHRSNVATLAIVGTGAAGVELACAMQQRLLRETPRRAPRMTLVGEASELLPDHPRAAAREFAQILATRSIATRLDTRIVDVDRAGAVTARGERIDADHVFLATGPAPASWLQATGLALDAAGFVAVDASLRSVSHPCVFAAGDCASLAGRTLAKAGVHAMREGAVLAHNLARLASGRPLIGFEPPRRALALITTGGRDAVASYGDRAARGRWIWYWKTAIDRRYVARYRMATPDAAAAD